MENKNKILKRAYFWNTCSGIVNAGQSALILVFLAHFLTNKEAGIFSIGIALGNLVSFIGKYGIRNFQVTDIDEQFSFNQYFSSRIITGLITFFISISYIVFQLYFGSYSIDKALTILFICLWKIVDTFEDVFYGMYQQRGRLDIGAKLFTLRVLISSIFMCILIVFGFSILLSSIVAFVVSVMISSTFISITVNNFDLTKIKTDFNNVRQLLLICFPLFLAETLSIYIANSPKYLIDLYLDDQAQAIFGYLMMPAFTIMVINKFIFRPIIRDLGELWKNPDKKPFIRRVLIQYIIVAAITLLVILCGITIGIPVLSFFYNTDLSNYKIDFIILLLGGGMYALSSFVMVPLTAMRLQNQLACGFIFISLLSILLGICLIQHSGVRGATLLYLALNTLLAIYLSVCFFLGIKRNNILFKSSYENTQL